MDFVFGVFDLAFDVFDFTFDVFNYAAKSLVAVRSIKRHRITIMSDTQLHPPVEPLLK